VPIPFFIRNSVINAVNIAEEKLGRPPNNIEIHATLQVLYGNVGFKFIKWGYNVVFLQQMYLEDVFYADKNFSCYSTNLNGNKEGFEKCSTRFKRLFKDRYHFDSIMTIRANPETTTLNLKELMRLFLSNDEKVWNDHKWIFDGERRYLDGTFNPSNKVAF